MERDTPYSFGKFKKTKYLLIFRKKVVYYFVTTIHTEEECIEIMIDKAKYLYTYEVRNFKIIKENSDGSEVIFLGRNI